jgi:hypothetical protein
MSDRQSLEEMLQELLNHAQIKGSLSNADLTQLQAALSGIQVEGNLAIGNITQTLLNLIVYVPSSFKPTETPHNLPYSGTIKFVGRVETLEDLRQMLQQSNQVVLTAIEGMGGVGKTELALQYAQLQLLLGTYSGGICWLRARDENVGLQVVRFAEVKLGIKTPEDWKLEDRVNFCWARWHEGDVLLILDDVNDYLKIKPYLPSQPSRFKMLLTTRLQLDLAKSLTLDVLDELAALELVEEWIGTEKIKQESEDAQQLCEQLGYLPLALNLVGRYIKKRRISLAEMLRRLNEKKLKHESLRRNQDDLALTLNIQRGVIDAFELSWDELCESAQELGQLLSLFALGAIPWHLVEKVEILQSKEALEDARLELEELHLIQFKNFEMYRLHQLIREFFIGKLANSPRENTLKQAFTDMMVKESNKIPDTGLNVNLVKEFEPVIVHLSEVATVLTDFLTDEDLNAPFIAVPE